MKIDYLWKKLRDYKLSTEQKFQKYHNVGASVEEIKRLEENLSTVLPESFTKSLKITNGEISVDTEDEDMSTWFGDWNTLLNCDKIFKESNDYYIHFSKEEHILPWDEIYGIKNIPQKWSDKFIVFFDNNCEIYALLDMREGDGKGQVLITDIEAGILAFWANSYEEWLEMAVDEVVLHGELRLETMEKLLRIKE